MATKKRHNKSKLGKRGSNYAKYGSPDKLASIQGELRTAKIGNIAPTYFINGKPTAEFKLHLKNILTKNNVIDKIEDKLLNGITASKVARSLTSRFTGEYAPGDSIVIDMDYNFNVPNWGINDFLNERSMFQKGISTLAGEPGHFYFKIFFNFDTSFGLLGSLLHVDDKSFSQFSTNTAIKYLMYSSIGQPHRSDDIPGRMLALFKFGNLLSYISNYSPWFFKSIKNLSSADVYPLTEIQNDKNTIEIELNPDAVDMRVTTLFDLYRYACYDRIKMKEIIPENLRKFDMDVMVFHVPLKYYNTAISSKSLKKKFDYKKLSDNMANMPSFKMYSFLGCEFDLESLGSLMPDIKNDKAGMIGEASIKINYTQVHTHTMNDWYRIMFGTDGFYYNANRENTNPSEVTLVEAAEKNSNYYTISATAYANNTDQSIFYDNKLDDEQYQRLKAKQAILDHLLYYNSTSSQYKELIDASEALCSDLYRAVAPNKALGNLYENIISGGVGPGSNYFKSKMKALHLGSDNSKESFQDKISKFWNTVKSFSANQMHI